MGVAIWIAVAIGVVLACGPITSGGTRKVNDRALATHVAKTGLPLPDALREPVIMRITHRERLASWCGVAGIVVGVAASFVLRALGWADAAGEGGDLSGVVVMLATGVGMSVGAVVATAGRRAELNPSAPRLAHGTEASLTDYLHRTELIALVGGAALTVLAGVFALVLSPHAPRTVVVGAMLATVVVVAVVLVVLRHVARRPQRAGFQLELAWDDVMRAAGLRQLLISGLVLNLVGTFVIILVGALDVVAPVSAGVAVIGAGVAAVVVTLGVPLPFWASRVPSYPLRRLWPAGIQGATSC